MNPTDEQLRLKIAAVLGWTNLSAEPHIVGTVPGKDYAANVPNWPGDRNIELPVGDKRRFIICLYETVNEEPFFEEASIGSEEAERMIFCTTSQFRLAWLLYKGWRWVECDDCEGGRAMERDLAHAHLECCACSGKGGEWVHERGGR